MGVLPDAEVQTQELGLGPRSDEEPELCRPTFEVDRDPHPHSLHGRGAL